MYHLIHMYSWLAMMWPVGGSHVGTFQQNNSLTSFEFGTNMAVVPLSSNSQGIDCKPRIIFSIFKIPPRNLIYTSKIHYFQLSNWILNTLNIILITYLLRLDCNSLKNSKTPQMWEKLPLQITIDLKNIHSILISQLKFIFPSFPELVTKLIRSENDDEPIIHVQWPQNKAGWSRPKGLITRRRNSLREFVSVKYGWLHMSDSMEFSHFFRFRSEWNQLQAHTDRTRFGNATFLFSMTFNFNIFQCFSNIRDYLSNFSYLVCISCKNFTRWRFYLFLKTENSRRVAESRPVCVGL
jgi:hypothetical protein